MKQIHRCKIIEKTFLLDKTISLVIDVSSIDEKIFPGQFFHVQCPGGGYLRRPISVCDVKNDNLRLIFEIRGTGTESLAKLHTGAEIDLLGPLGRGFYIPKEGTRVALVGGGIGTFPLLYLAKSLPFPCDVFLGFRCEEQIVLADEFKALPNVNLILCTDNGSCGYCGFAPAAFSEYLNSGRKYDIVYTCGPKIMMSCVAKEAKTRAIPCQVSLEERMGCGIGACLVCACKLQNQQGAPRMGHVCKDGPVFWADDVIW